MTWKTFWDSFRVGLAHALMEGRYQHRVDVVNDAGEIVSVLWSLDKRTHDYTFVVTPRYHTRAPESTSVN